MERRAGGVPSLAGTVAGLWELEISPSEVLLEQGLTALGLENGTEWRPREGNCVLLVPRGTAGC